MNRSESEIRQNWKTNEIVLSICCITYNHGEFLASALDSFLMQETDFPFEIVVGEDRSSDNTQEVLDRYLEAYPNMIRVIQSETNVGSTRNFDRVMRAAKGRYLAYCEGDDYWTDPLKLQKNVSFLEQNSEYVLTYSRAMAEKDGVLLDEYAGGNECDVDKADLQRACAINTLTVCWRNVLQEFPPEFFGAPIGDIFIWSLLGAHGKGKFQDDVQPSVYRLHQGGVFSSKSQLRKQRMRSLTFALMMSYYDRVGDAELAEYFGEELCRSAMKAVGAGRIIRMKLVSMYRRVFPDKNEIV